MRVITGKARGSILTPLSGEKVRPTTAKVKEAIFSSIQFEVSSAMFLDLFCGSGQMGIEALSRGAGFSIFVDMDFDSIKTTKQNLVNTGLTKQSRVVQMGYESFLAHTKDEFDIAFLDPPYSQHILQNAIPLLVKKMSKNGIILCEHEKTDHLPEKVFDFCLIKQYNYSRISISKYQRIAGE